MKLFSLMLLSFFGLSAFSQQNNNAVIDYTEYNNTESPNTLTSTLYIQNSITIFLPKFTTQVFNNPKEEANRTNRITMNTDYLKIDHSNKQVLSIEGFQAEYLLVKDEYPNLQWNVSQEEKVIGKYKCIKATTNYRGRDWVAWFAPEIPLNYGPWKLYGLPGLIVEASDASNRYGWRIEKIEFKNDTVFEKDFNTLVKVKSKTPISKKKLLEDLAEYDANLNAQMKQLMPDMGEPVNIRTGYELKYEWETK
ncbi:GLPGLI family protein [Flavobacterium sp. NRK1]|uniref:GLPGLI family protein n=1 Tax=Flavobacterium sp. NRK1 TaxID=2954929 RepID=UPI0020924691|nr:GLPGLI family protein [Flavobacterium sp. NRK1]MCO6148968.1 GLPGLI family protein [Flavobacterium sp. NRK1]